MEAYMMLNIWVRGDVETLLDTLKAQKGLSFKTDDPDMVEYIKKGGVQFDAYKIDDPQKAEEFGFYLAEEGKTGLFIQHSLYGVNKLDSTAKEVQKVRAFRDYLKDLFPDTKILDEVSLEIQ